MGLCNLSHQLSIPTLTRGMHYYSLAVLPTKAPIHWIPTQRLIILIRLQRAITVVDLDFLGLDEEVGGYVGTGDFAAVGAVAEMAAFLGEELGVGNGDGYTAAETCAD